MHVFQRVDHIICHHYGDDLYFSVMTLCSVLMKLLQGSPFLSRCDSLKKKMAAFQCLMEEDEEKDEQKKNEENESDKSTLAKDCKNGQSLLKMLTAAAQKQNVLDAVL